MKIRYITIHFSDDERVLVISYNNYLVISLRQEKQKNYDIVLRLWFVPACFLHMNPNRKKRANLPIKIAEITEKHCFIHECNFYTRTYLNLNTIPKKRGYIARKYYAHAYRAQTLYEEAFFENFEAAKKYIEEISEEDCDLFLSEIVSLLFDDKEPWENEQIWTFDRKGNLIRFYDASDRYENCHVIEKDGYKEVYAEPEPQSYTGKFKVGDIVTVRAYPWNQDSPIPYDTIGVIITTPIPYEIWRNQEKQKYGWDNTYVINFIRDGYLEHMHIKEQYLTIYTNDIPENLSFLKHLSDHYRGKIKIREDILQEIHDGKIFVEKVNHFDEKKSIKT